MLGFPAFEPRMRIVLAVLSALVFAAAAMAQTTPAAAQRGFWWEATKGNQRVLLMGTLHVGRADFYPLPPDAMRRLREAAVIAVEADVFNVAKTGPIVQRMAFYADGEPGLDARLPAELRRRVEAAARRAGLEASRLWRMKPWMLANTLVLLEAVRSGFTPAFATESFLFEFTQQTGKPIAELESLEAQLRIFESASAELQIVYLEQVIKSMESGESEREVTRLVDAWSRGDAAAMEALLAKMRAGAAPADRFVMEQIIDGRHPAMVAGIERMAASGRLHVVAVGALHFSGPNGLVELLRRRGFAVRPL